MRSSSYGSYSICQAQWFFQYVLCLPSPSGAAAARGNVVHKFAELLALQKLAMQNGHECFHEEELDGVWPVDDFTTEDALREAWRCYKEVRGEPSLQDEDFETCRELANTLLSLGNGQYNPLNRTVVTPERYFEFELEQPWAQYDYRLPDGRRLAGRLKIKGTLDLVCEMEGGGLELIDFKTGRRMDWGTRQVKDYDSLRTDFQLLLYFWGMRKLFPKVKDMLVTIVYVRDGGPFTIPFGVSDLANLERLIRERFEEIKSKQMPDFVWDDPVRRKRTCQSFCHFGKSTHEESGKSLCQHYRDEMLTLGTDRVTAKYADLSKLNAYEGGGRSGK